MSRLNDISDLAPTSPDETRGRLRNISGVAASSPGFNPDIEDKSLRIKQLKAEKAALGQRFLRTDEEDVRKDEIESELTALVIPPDESLETYQEIALQSQGATQVSPPWELFTPVFGSQALIKWGTAATKGVLTRAGTIATIATVTDIPIELLAEQVGKTNPWLGVALSVGLSIPMAHYVDARIEARVFNQILKSSPNFFTKNLKDIVSVNTKNVSQQAKARMEVLASRMDKGDYVAFKESQDLLRKELYQEIEPDVNMSTYTQEKVKPLTRTQANREVLKRDFSDVSDADLDAIQKIAEIDSFKGFDVEFNALKNKINNKLALDAYRNHPITPMIESIKRGGGFSEEQLVLMLGEKATAQLKKRHPGIVQQPELILPGKIQIDETSFHKDDRSLAREIAGVSEQISKEFGLDLKGVEHKKRFSASSGTAALAGLRD